MPPDRTTGTATGRKPFKPPRPSGTNQSSKSQSQSTSRARPSGSSRLSGSFARPSGQSQSQSQSLSQSQTDFDLSQSQDEDEIGGSGRAVVVDDEDPSSDAKAKIPSQLLTRILHEMMKENGHDNSRVGKTADKVVGRYVDCFVREAIARAVWERREAEEKEKGGRGLGGGFLEVEDLEKLAPQLVLDF